VSGEEITGKEIFCITGDETFVDILSTVRFPTDTVTGDSMNGFSRIGITGKEMFLMFSDSEAKEGTPGDGISIDGLSGLSDNLIFDEFIVAEDEASGVSITGVSIGEISGNELFSITGVENFVDILLIVGLATDTVSGDGFSRTGISGKEIFPMFRLFPMLSGNTGNVTFGDCSTYLDGNEIFSDEITGDEIFVDILSTIGLATEGV
jgi:hypothetical protein